MDTRNGTRLPRDHLRLARWRTRTPRIRPTYRPTFAKKSSIRSRSTRSLVAAPNSMRASPIDTLAARTAGTRDLLAEMMADKESRAGKTFSNPPALGPVS